MHDIVSPLPNLGTATVQSLTLVAICSVRLFVILFIFPPTADGILQGAVRNGVVVIFSLFIAYGQPAAFLDSLSGMMLIEIGLKEALIGLVLGISASTVFWVAEGAGTYVDDLTGYNSVQITNPMREDSSTPTAALLSQIAIVAFWTFGGMTFLLSVLYESYRWWPIASQTPIASNVIESFALSQTDTLMQTTAKLAMPMVFILLLIDFAFGFGAKSAQKLDLMSLSQPVKGMVAVLMLALFVGIFVDQVHDQLVLTHLSDQLRSIADAAHK
jgi:type III secretion protein T